jgi:N-acetylglucosamine-6-phosphate deacetylase
LPQTYLEGNIPGRGWGRVAVADGRIASVELGGSERPGGPILAPGLVDIQLNGFVGVDFSSPELVPEDAPRILPDIWRTGCTTFCPTLITNTVENLARNFRVLEQARTADARFRRATPCYHLEGPYLSPGPAHGVHNAAWMHPPDWDEFQRLQEAAGGNIGIVTLAPELPGALEFIRRLRGSAVVPAVGHTDGSPEDIHRAVDSGAMLATHLGNGCGQMLPRHTNPLWAQLAADGLAASIICDTFHLPPDVVKVTLRSKGTSGTILITDAGHVTGLAPGRYQMLGVPIELLPSGKVAQVDGSSLAGSALTMNRAVALFRDLSGAPLADAIEAAAGNPARLIAGCAGAGDLCAAIVPGLAANLIVARPAPGELTIEAVYAAGEEVYRAGQ